MIKSLALILVLITSHTLLAQQHVLDSLLNVLPKHSAKDTIRLNLLNDIAFEYSFIDPDKGIAAAGEAISIALETGNRSKLAASYSNKGVNYAAKGNDSAALALYKQALAIHEEQNNLLSMARVFNNMAIIYVGLSDYAKALEYHGKSLAIFEKTGDKLRMANALNNTGVVYLYLADYPKALGYYLKALSILEGLDNSSAIANNLSNIGIIYKNLEDYQKAIHFHEKALALYIKTGNKQGIANTMGNIGVVYDKSDKKDRALEYFQKGLSINNVLGNKIRVASDLTNIGTTYQGLHQYDTALKYYEKALDIYKTAGDRNSIVIVLNQLAGLYTEAPATALKSVGSDKEQRIKKALNYLSQSLQIAQETGVADRLSETWAILSSTYEKQTDFEKALNAYKQHIIYRDSIHNVENEKQITRNEMQFGFEKKQALAAAEIRRERVLKNAIAGGAIILLLGGITSFIFYKRKLNADKKKQAAELAAEVAETEMKVLRLQMNPHFIFNSLNSVADYINRNNIAEADRYLTKFARLMRMTLENSEQNMVSLCNDLEALELYLQLESLRLDQKFSYKFNIDESIDIENTMIPPLLLQPFVENSILHGISAKQGEGTILVHIYSEENMLCCVVEDNGIGRSAAAASKVAGTKRSMALNITRSRISLLNKTRKTNAVVNITDVTEGTKAIVKLPLHLNFN